MTNLTTPSESMGAASAMFYRWEVPDKPISICISLELIDRLEKDVIESFKAVTKRGSEIGGVLAGRVVSGGKPTVVIEHFEPVECDYSRGPLYLLSDEDKARLRQAIERVGNGGNGLSVTGFFRSNTRRELILDEEDQAVAKEFFSDPNHVFLLVRPFAMKPSAGGFYFWENGQIQGESTYLQFPFKRSELVKSFEQFIVPAPGAPAAAAPPAREPLVMPKREERVVTPSFSFRREEPKPTVSSPPVREEPPAPPPVAFKEEPKAPVLPPKQEEPAAFRREESRPVTPPAPRTSSFSFRREERPPAPPAARQEPVLPSAEERVSGPLGLKRDEQSQPLLPKREERALPPLGLKREEPAPPAREERPAPPLGLRRTEPLLPKREERTLPPLGLKREEPAPPKREERQLPPLSSRREEPAPPKREERQLPPLSAKREEPPAPPKRELPPLSAKRGDRPALTPGALKREERSAPPPVSKVEEPLAPPAPPVTVRRDDRPPVPPVTVKREEKPGIVVKREERPAVAPPAPRHEEPAPARREERVVAAKPAEPPPMPPPLKRQEPARVEAHAEAEEVAPAEHVLFGEQEAPEPGLFSRMKWAIIAAVLVVAIAGGGYYAYRTMNVPAKNALKPADMAFGLKVEPSAGQLLLTWNRNAPMITGAAKATLTIMDGDHKEDVDLDLGQLRSGSIVYSPISNDVSFRLEAVDKAGKSQAELVRRLAGRPSPAVAALPTPVGTRPVAGTPERPSPASQPAVSAAAPAAESPGTPTVVAGPAVTLTPPKPESLATRLRAPEPQEVPEPELPEPPSIGAQAGVPVGRAPVASSSSVPAPPPVAPPPAATTPAPAARAAQPTPPRTGVARAARLLKSVAPVYPTLARRNHITGIVRVQATIGTDGKVKKARVVSGPPLLRQAATDAVMRWLYSPAILNGEPVEADTQVDVNFMM